MPQFYEDDPKYLAKVQLNGRDIRLRETPESKEFLQSLISLTDAEQMLGASIWICQKSLACFHNETSLTTTPFPVDIQEMHIEPFTTPEGERFFESIEGITDPEKKQIIGMFLHELGRQLLARAADANPDIIPNDASCEEE